MAFLSDIDLGALLTPETVLGVAGALFVALLAFVALRVLVIVLRRVLRGRTTPQVAMLVTKAVNYTGLAIIVSIFLLEIGVNLAPILGAAGIVGLAVGIASQASLSNMISGLFLVSEKPFEVGDVIRTADTTGIVESIDLLSVKIRTFDNLYVRVPNEKLANNLLTNITRFPIRRMDFTIQVRLDADIARVSDVLLSIAHSNSGCLQEPAPIVLPLEFSEFGARVLFGVWFLKTDLVRVRNELFGAIVRELPANGIPLAVPRRALDAGEPFPVCIVDPTTAGERI